ncbi:hypothetical protein HU830_04895 [Lactobacillus sp. DCY120]|uniref:Uncharacterized protein n=1 Tax=Bombilactobacillus apium TaxID=2675299 RepID=A0A850RB09_9LACO|nr:hypothetical protein [Bombilactobacillus apium]NVY96506.1 hypothetical protein [Bombilactobacillus apium]
MVQMIIRIIFLAFAGEAFGLTLANWHQLWSHSIKLKLAAILNIVSFLIVVLAICSVIELPRQGAFLGAGILLILAKLLEISTEAKTHYFWKIICILILLVLICW